MSELEFDGARHQISLYSDGALIGTWAAYNNVDRHATLTHVPNGIYTVLDKTSPCRHAANANGPYGLYGIVRFYVRGHPGIGVHSGRAFAKHLPGPQHPTMGCIRTSDEAMGVIVETMKKSPITSIRVISNSASFAHAASRRNHGRSLQGHYA